MGVSTACSAEILRSCQPRSLEKDKAGSIPDRMLQPHSVGKELHQLRLLEVVHSLWKAAQFLNTSARYTIQLREEHKEHHFSQEHTHEHVSVTTLNLAKTLCIANIDGCGPSSAFGPRKRTSVGEKFPQHIVTTICSIAHDELWLNLRCRKSNQMMLSLSWSLLYTIALFFVFWNIMVTRLSWCLLIFVDVVHYSHMWCLDLHYVYFAHHVFPRLYLQIIIG